MLLVAYYGQTFLSLKLCNNLSSLIASAISEPSLVLLEPKNNSKLHQT